MTRHPAKPTGLPPDLCFMKRVVSGPSVIVWDFKSEADLAKPNSTRYALAFAYDLRVWIGHENRSPYQSIDLSYEQVKVLRSLLPPAELAFATALTLGVEE